MLLLFKKKKCVSLPPFLPTPPLSLSLCVCVCRGVYLCVREGRYLLWCMHVWYFCMCVQAPISLCTYKSQMRTQCGPLTYHSDLCFSATGSFHTYRASKLQEPWQAACLYHLQCWVTGPSTRSCSAF